MISSIFYRFNLTVHRFKVQRSGLRTKRDYRSEVLKYSNYNIKISNKIKSQVFGILNFGHCDLPFDPAQGGGELVEPFVICILAIVI